MIEREFEEIYPLGCAFMLEVGAVQVATTLRTQKHTIQGVPASKLRQTRVAIKKIGILTMRRMGNPPRLVEVTPTRRDGLPSPFASMGVNNTQCSKREA
jgi:hypothetical protein